MTRDEILAMEPGRELDTLVAERLFSEPNEDVFFIAQANGPHTYDKDGFTVEWSPSTDMRAAWEVFIKFDLPSISAWSDVDDNDYFTCNIGVHHVSAKTAPAAICKCALMAVMNWEVTA